MARPNHKSGSSIIPITGPTLVITTRSRRALFYFSYAISIKQNKIDWSLQDVVDGKQSLRRPLQSFQRSVKENVRRNTLRQWYFIQMRRLSRRKCYFEDDGVP